MPDGAIVNSFMSFPPPGTWTANDATLSAQDAYLKAYWKGENLNDSIGSHTLTNVNSATFTAGKHNDAFTLNGSTQYVYAADSGDWDLGTTYTISCWVNFSASVSGTAYGIMNRYDATANNRAFGFHRWSNDILYFNHSYDAIGSIDSVLVAWQPNTSTWYHLVVSADGTDLRLWIDADLKDTTALSGAMNASTIPWEIGRTNTSGSGYFYFPGQEDECPVWKGYGADQAFVTALNNGGTGAFLI